ncbi:MAG: hypothetical protein ACLFNN_01525 [Candidatus Paceibacterota bacterium]
MSKKDIDIETKDVSGMADAVAGTETKEATATDSDGNSATARGVSSEQAADKAVDKLGK